MRLIRPAALAKRLGVQKSAIANALTRGKLVKLPSGDLDLDDPVNVDYLARFSLHRGRSQAAPTSPGRAAAQLERARAEYLRRYADLIERKKLYTSTLWVWHFLNFLFEKIRAALPEFPDRIDWADPLGPEIAWEKAMKWVLEAPFRDHDQWDPPVRAGDPPPWPPEDPGHDLDAVRAARDVLAARRHDLEGDISKGTLITWEESTRIKLEYAGPALNQGLLYYPRRTIASFLAVEYSRGRDAALCWLRESIAEEVGRLDSYLGRIKERLA